MCGSASFRTGAWRAFASMGDASERRGKGEEGRGKGGGVLERPSPLRGRDRVAALLRVAALGGADARRPPVRERRRAARGGGARVVDPGAGGLARGVRGASAHRRAQR